MDLGRTTRHDMNCRAHLGAVKESVIPEWRWGLARFHKVFTLLLKMLMPSEPSHGTV